MGELTNSQWPPQKDNHLLLMYKGTTIKTVAIFYNSGNRTGVLQKSSREDWLNDKKSCPGGQLFFKLYSVLFIVPRLIHLPVSYRPG